VEWISGRAEDAQTQQIELGAAVHGAFDELQAVDMTFAWAVAPDLLHSHKGRAASSRQRGLVKLANGDPALASRQRGPSGRFPLADDTEELTRQASASGQFRGLLSCPPRSA